MKISAKKVTKVAGAACAATGIVTLSALTASGAAVRAVVEGFKTASNTMKKILTDETKKEILIEVQPNDDNVAEGDSLL